MRPRHTPSDAEDPEQALRDIIIRLARQRAWADHVAAMTAQRAPRET